jgi:adenosylmethionine-8-amino-7-oxononanoate aminotransferase
VLAAMRAQLDALEYAHTSFFTTPVAEALADDLVAHAPEGIEHVFFVSGGSEAIEAALKLARQCFVERGEPQRRFIIARRQSYHGITLGALAIGGREAHRQKFAPLLIETHHVSPVYEYRERRADENASDYAERLARELENKIAALGSDNVMAFVAETVVGATLGAVPAVPNYFQRVREICDRHGILLILDEVMCGMGRTGTLYACEQEAVRPDMVAIAKGMGGGYAPIGALLISGEIFRSIADGSGAFAHSHTYMGHPLACAAALAVQQIIRRDDLLANVRRQGAHLARRLGERFGNHPFVGNVRGRGLLQGVELVVDRGSKEPFDPRLKLHARIKREAMTRGLMVYPMGGTADGIRGDHVLLAPPFIADTAAVDTIVERLGEAVDAATAPVM